MKTWNHIKADEIERIDLVCATCNRINIKIKGEDSNCDFCGTNLFDSQSD